jgi:hypothetical protein
LRQPGVSAQRIRTFNDRRVSAFRQIDDDLIFLPFFAVVTSEARTQTPGLDANDRVSARVEARVLSKDLHPDQKLFEMRAAAGNGFSDNEADKTFQPVGLVKSAAGKNAIQLQSRLLLSLVIDSRRRGLAARGATNLSSSRPPKAPYLGVAKPSGTYRERVIARLRRPFSKSFSVAPSKHGCTTGC